ncbi:MAG: LLM class flavin-dependent oxidoreductase [Armatimonas sp.]
MKLSLFFDVNATPQRSLGDVLGAIEERVLLAETLGFDTAWFAEHHFGKYGRLTSPLHLIARLSGLTRSLKLGTAVLPAPFYNLARLKEDVELVDTLTNGRLKLGLGFGESGDTASWEAFGASAEERVELTQASAAHFAEAFAGRLYIAGGSTTPGWIAESGYGLLLPRVGGTENHLQRLDCYRAGPGRHTGLVAALRLVYVAPSWQEARVATQPLITRLTLIESGSMAPHGDLLTHLNVASGDVDQVRDCLTHWHQTLGLDELLCQIDAPELSHEALSPLSGATGHTDSLRQYPDEP